MRKLFFHIAAMIVLLTTSCSEMVGNFDDGNPLRKSPVYVNVDPNINLGGLEFSFVEIPEGCFSMIDIRMNFSIMLCSMVSIWVNTK